MLEELAKGTGGTVDLTRDPRGERYFLEMLDWRPVDVWERSRRNGLLNHYGNYLGLVVLAGLAAAAGTLGELFERADRCYPCLLGMAGALLETTHQTTPIASPPGSRGPRRYAAER